MSVISCFLLFVLLACIEALKIPSKYYYFLLWLGLAFVYACLVYIISPHPQTYPLLRQARALVSSSVLILVAYNLRLAPADFYRLLSWTLLANALAVLIQVGFPQSQPLFAQLYDFTKTFNLLRGFGITAGYDTAGFFCVLGSAMSAIGVYYSEKILPFIFPMFIFMLATVLHHEII